MVVISSHLLGVVGHVGQHGGHVEHDLVALVGGVQRVGARRISWRKSTKTDVSVGLMTLNYRVLSQNTTKNYVYVELRSMSNLHLP